MPAAEEREGAAVHESQSPIRTKREAERTIASIGKDIREWRAKDAEHRRRIGEEEEAREATEAAFLKEAGGKGELLFRYMIANLDRLAHGKSKTARFRTGTMERRSLKESVDIPDAKATIAELRRRRLLKRFGKRVWTLVVGEMNKDIPAMRTLKTVRIRPARDRVSIASNQTDHRFEGTEEDGDLSWKVVAPRTQD